MDSDFRNMWAAVGGKVPAHWKFVAFSDLLEHPKSLAVGVMYPGPDAVGGVPLVRVSDIKDGEVQGEPNFHISQEVDLEYRRTRFDGYELLITLVGNPGDCALVSESMKGWNAARAVAVVKLKDPELRPWLRYVLLSKPAKHLMDARLNTTVQKTLNLKDIRELRLPIPPESERTAITRTLKSIDGKIVANRRINQTLEAMAQAIFKSWFVDFDPVKAKIAAKERWLAQHSPLPSEEGSGVRALSTKPRLPEAILSFARENRAHATDAEALMWRLLRNRQFGAKFRRQHPQPPYILDFYCHEHRLAIELDGGQHYTAEGAEADRARSVALQQQGITVLRFSNREVLLETEVVLECVWGRLNSEVALTPTPLTPTPLPEGEGLEDAMLRAAMSAISGIPEAKLDALKLHPSPSGTTTGMSEVEQRLQLLPRGAWGEGSRYDDLAATAALFPDEMEASELGEIPRGWRYSTVGDSFILTMGQSPPGDTYNESGEGLPFYQGRTDFGFRFPSQRVFCTAPTRFAEPDDTLVSVRAPVGDMNMALEKCCLGRGVAGIRHPKGYRSIVFYSLRELRSRFDTFDSEGTVFGSINKKDFQALPVIQPPIEVLAAFERVTTPMDQRVIENEKQIRTLLPKLLSGELPVENLSPESEATV